MFFSLISPVEGLEHQAAYTRNAQPHDSHRWLWTFFRDQTEEDKRFLYHVRYDKRRVPVFYVLSDKELVSPESCWQVQSKEFAPQLKAGIRLAFELRANPVVTRPREDGVLNKAGKTRGSRHDLVMDLKKRLLQERGLSEWKQWQPDRCTEDGRPDPRPTMNQLVQQATPEWLVRQGERHGFAVEQDAILATAYEQHRVPRKGSANDMRFSTVDFSGVLTVTDPDKLLTAIHQGLGKCKAFGCGLLLVKPVSV